MSRDASPSRPILDALLHISYEDVADGFTMLIPSKNLTEWSHDVFWTWSRSDSAEREVEDKALQKEAQRLWDNIFESNVWSGLKLRNSATIEKPCCFYEITCR